MIINYTEKGWEVITQRTHGLLAAQLASHWNESIRGKRWLETLLAVAEHDDAQIELERGDLVTLMGGPVDFKMRKFDPQHCGRTLDFAISKSRYIALLCSMHLVFINSDFAADDAEAASFIKKQKALQRNVMKELKIRKTEAERDYRLLEWCDALSLLLCQQENQPEGRTIEISNGPDNRHYQLKQCGEAKLTIRPWPFQETTFEVAFETRLIRQLKFKDSADFRAAFKQSKILEKRWIFSTTG